MVKYAFTLDGFMASSTPSAHATLSEWLHFLEHVHTSTIDLGLDRVEQVLSRLEISWGQAVVITVAGTNGKGSTCAMLESILLAAGYKVGTYSSPHLFRFNERARYNGQELTDERLVEGFHAVAQKRGTISLSYFEWTMLGIFSAFSQLPLDVVILEVGLGGRLDAVNVVDADCSIVTSVAIDHVEYLGSTRESIGYEKAGIFRKDRPAICADPEPPLSLKEHALQIGADLRCIGRDFHYHGDQQQWNFKGRQSHRPALPYPSLRGVNQLLNASAALAALDALHPRLVVPQQAVRQGLLQVQLAGRFQIMPGQPCIIYDVAHNPHAAAVLSENLFQMPYYPMTYAVIGMYQDKDCFHSILPLIQQVDVWFCVTIDGERGAQASSIAQSVREAMRAEKVTDVEIIECDDFVGAAEQLYGRLQKEDRAVIFGSFVTVAAMQAIQQQRLSMKSDEKTSF